MSLDSDKQPKPIAFRNTVRLKRLVKGAVITGTIIFVLDLSLIAAFSLIRLPVPHVDAVLVLGAKVGTPALTERALQGLKYYQEGKTNVIVLSGNRGAGEPISEAEAMEKVLERRIAQTGGKMPKVILEPKSINTFQNIHNSKALVPNANSVVIVSDCFHLARSVVIAKRDGLQEVYWDAPAPSYYPLTDLAFYYLREAAGMLAYIPKLITK